MLNPGNFGEQEQEQVPQKVLGDQEHCSSEGPMGKGTRKMSLKRSLGNRNRKNVPQKVLGEQEHKKSSSKHYFSGNKNVVFPKSF